MELRRKLGMRCRGDSAIAPGGPGLSPGARSAALKLLARRSRAARLASPLGSPARVEMSAGRSGTAGDEPRKNVHLMGLSITTRQYASKNGPGP